MAATSRCIEAKNCCVIGSSGCLGRELVAELLKRGYSVNGFDIQDPVERDERVRYFKGSITNKEELLPAIEGVDVVFNTASPNFFCPKPHLFRLINVEGAKNVIQCCIEANVPRLVVTSSATVLYNGKDGKNQAEDDLPYSTYDDGRYIPSKVAMEKAVLAANGSRLANGKGKLMTAAIRPHALFGPGDLTTAARLDGRQDNNYAIGRGDNLIDYCYSTNVAHGHILAAERLSEGSEVCGQAFNIGSEDPMGLHEFNDRLVVELGYKPPTKLQLPIFMLRIMAYIAIAIQAMCRWVGVYFVLELTPLVVQLSIIEMTLSTSKARKMLGYKPIVSMDESIRRTGAYYKAIREKKKKTA